MKACDGKHCHEQTFYLVPASIRFRVGNGIQSSLKLCAIDGTISQVSNFEYIQGPTETVASGNCCSDNYFASRGKDFLDIFALKLSYNRPLSGMIHVRVCKGLEIGLGHFNGWKVGFEKCGIGVLSERKTAGGVFAYDSWIVQKVHWQTNEAYERSLRNHGRHAAQVLLTAEDLEHRTRYLNARNTILALLELGAVPGINDEQNQMRLIDCIQNLSLDVIGQIVTIYDNYGFHTEVIVASIRNPVHVLDAALMGADISTVPYKVMEQLIKHPLTNIGLESFLADWKKMG